MGVKKLRTVFLEYVLVLALAVLAVIAANVGLYLLGVQSGAICPLNRVSAAVESAKGALQSAERIEARDIPPLCGYVLFTADGRYQAGSIAPADSAYIWTLCMENGRTSDSPYLYSVIDREDGVLILRYRMAAQFTSAALRRLFPAADLLLLALILLESLLALVAVSCIFGRALGKKLDKLLAVVHKIEQQDLDFTVQKSRLLEIDRALDALERMRGALQRALAQQWQADKLRQDQLSALAHDLKTPLTIIRGNTELLLDTALSPEQRECADYIAGSALQMQDYVQALIEATKAWDSARPCQKQADLDALLRELKARVAGLCAMRRVTLHWACGPYPASIAGDPALLIRMLVNVLTNAVEHTPPGGAVTFAARAQAGTLLFQITDTGKGFSAQALRHATEQFFMEDDSRSGKGHYGIGLYAAASIAKKHGGQLLLENAAAPAGARVTIRLPC